MIKHVDIGRRWRFTLFPRMVYGKREWLWYRVHLYDTVDV